MSTTNIQFHPSTQLQPGWIELIHTQAPIAEKEGRLQPAQLQLAYQQQWFKMLVPKQYGGLELSLPAEVRSIEAISWADGSMGWAVTLCTGAGWFGGFLDPGLSTGVFPNPDVCLAGSGAHGGKAIITEDGYLITGSWKYASGALHATHFTANCIICNDDDPLTGDDDKPIVKAFLFDKADVEVLPAWNYTGMVATGSHSFAVNNLQVDASRAFIIDADYLVVDAPLYHYPFLQLAEATLAVNLSGMAIHFADLAEKAFAEKRLNKDLSMKQQNELDEALQSSVKKMNAVRTVFYEAVDQSWLDYEDPSLHHREANLKKVSETSRKLAKASLQIVDSLYPYCGLIAASTSSTINQVWRDVHTASQHALLTFNW